MNAIRNNIINHILSLIVNDKLSENDKIPTEVELMKRFDTNRMNAHFAVKSLEKEGIVIRNKRRGTVVSDRLKALQISKLQTLSSNRVHILATPSKNKNIHWNLDTLVQLENELKNLNLSVFFKEIPDLLNEQVLTNIIKEINDIGSRALIIFPVRPELEYFINNADVLESYEGEVFLFNRGGKSTRHWPYHCVNLDPLWEGDIVGRYLFEYDIDDIIYLKSDTGFYWEEQRQKGLTHRIKKWSKNGKEVRIVNGNENSIYEKCCKIIKNSKSTPVIVSCNDYHAVNLIKHAEKNCSIRVPEHFKLISFDNNPAYLTYNLTTVGPPISEISHVFAKMIEEISWTKRDGFRMSVTVDSKMIKRETF